MPRPLWTSAVLVLNVAGHALDGHRSLLERRLAGAAAVLLGLTAGATLWRRHRHRRRIRSQAPQTPPPQPDAPLASDDTTVLTMPALYQGIDGAMVTRWLKETGQPVEADEPLLEISTDKVDTEIPSPVTGTVLEIRAAQGETLPTGAALAVIRLRQPPCPGGPGTAQ